MHNSLWQPLQNNLLFDTTNGSLGYSFIRCVGFISVGSLIELSLLFFFPQGGFLKTERFLAKSEAFGALKTLSGDELELLSVDSVIELDAVEPLSLSTCCVIRLTLQRSKSSSSLQDSSLMLCVLSELSSEDKSSCSLSSSLSNTSHYTLVAIFIPRNLPIIPKLFIMLSYSNYSQNYSGIIDRSLLIRMHPHRPHPLYN